MFRTLSALVLALVLGHGAAAQAPQPPKVRLILDFALQGQQSPFILAAEGGYFARAGVEVEVDRGYGSGDAITKVVSGAYDMAFADIGAMIDGDVLLDFGGKWVITVAGGALDQRPKLFDVALLFGQPDPVRPDLRQIICLQDILLLLSLRSRQYRGR